MKKILEVETRTVREVYVEPLEENKDYVYFKDFHTEYHGDKRVAKGVISGITLKSCTENLGPKDVVDDKIPVPWMYEGYGSVVGIPKEKYDDIMKGRVHIHDVWRVYYKILRSRALCLLYIQLRILEISNLG